MIFRIRFSEEKNQILKAERGISFDDVVAVINNGEHLDDVSHFDKSRKNQRLFIVKIQSYVYVVPYVINHNRCEIFLKTIYPSRKYTRLYHGKDKK